MEQFLSIVGGIIVGIVIFSVISNMYDINRYGRNGVIIAALGSFFVGVVSVSFIIGIVNGVLGLAWTLVSFLFKIAVICGVIYLIYYAYNQWLEKKNNNTKFE